MTYWVQRLWAVKDRLTTAPVRQLCQIAAARVGVAATNDA